MRNISVDELEGFQNALLELCIPIDLKDYNTIDLCGTGGDNKDTFNIKNNFFSARRSIGRNESDYGRNISIIMIN